MSDGTTVVDPTETVEVQNVVGAADLDRELDLMALATDLTNTDYDPERFAGLLYRTRDPVATVMVFRSGKVTVTGASTIGDMREAFEEFADTLRDLGIPFEPMSEIETQNLVANADLGERLNLSAIAIGLGLEQTEYEPEQFPGLVYRLDAPEVVILLFGTGKTVITGATDRMTIETAVETVTERLNDLSLLPT